MLLIPMANVVKVFKYLTLLSTKLEGFSPVKHFHPSLIFEINDMRCAQVGPYLQILA